MKYGSPKHIDEVAQLIYDYLQNNAEAGDTLEGIAEWWILGQRINESMVVVQKAIEKLKTAGVIIERRTANHPVIYVVRIK
jgi:hypothetical protein